MGRRQSSLTALALAAFTAGSGAFTAVAIDLEVSGGSASGIGRMSRAAPGIVERRWVPPSGLLRHRHITVPMAILPSAAITPIRPAIRHRPVRQVQLN